MSTETHAFQAEVGQLLDIVARSLYTDRDIFLRELVSNASDALEKLQHLQLTGQVPEGELFDANLSPSISVTTDDVAKTITVTDTGIGLTREELHQYLGTIAHSGTKNFLKALEAGAAARENVIGQFGVGFYSAFMVSDKVEVYTHSWHKDAEHLRWSSDGSTGYSIEEAPGQRRGTKIVLHLKEDSAEFSQKFRAKNILETHSRFVSFPLELNGERVNTVGALWLKPKNEVTEEEASEFFQFIAHESSPPLSRLHFQADAPIVLNALLFIPKENREIPGFGQIDPGVSLYSRKVLIDPSPDNLLPEWLRFVRGVIDSADLPLNISRESMQDSALLRKVGDVVTGRFLKHLEKLASDQPDTYTSFYRSFRRFLKEGAATSYTHRDKLARLLRFPSTFTSDDALTGLVDYVARMKEGQSEIYYQAAPSRQAIEDGPFLPAFTARGLEVLFFDEPVDEYLASQLTEFEGKRLVSISGADIELPDAPVTDDQEGALPEEQFESFLSWAKQSLGAAVKEIRKGKRTGGAPAIALAPQDAVPAQMREMLRAMGQEAPSTPVVLELDPSHPAIHRIEALRQSDEELAALAARNLLDTSLLAAGQLEDPAAAARRAQDLLARLL